MEIFSFGCCTKIAGKPGSPDSENPYAGYAPTDIPVFPQKQVKPGKQDYHMLIDNRTTTGGATATETLYIYLLKEGVKYWDKEALVFVLKPLDILVVDYLPPDLLYQIQAQNSTSSSINRMVQIWGSPKVLGP